MTVPQIAGIDLAVQAVVELLQSAAMAAAIVAVANDRADGVPMYDAFERVYDHEIDPETVGERFFAIVLAPRAERSDPFAFSQITNRSTDDLLNRLTIGVVLHGDDASLMTKQVQRTIIAVRECIRENLTTLLPYSIRGADIRLGSEDYEPIALIPGDNNILMKAGTIEVGVPMIS